MSEQTTEVMTTEEALAVRKAQALIELSDDDIKQIGVTIKQAEKLVTSVLEEGIDYGIHPGTSSMALKDSGASKIANAFNCYPEHEILHLREDDEVISYLVQAKMVSRVTGNVVAVGVGACSTMESKYAYRWVDDPAEYGLSKEGLKYDKRKRKYRIPNPEAEDLGNTILKMASKRAEIDADQSLPGVGSALKKLFNKDQKPKTNWQTFYGELTALELDETKAKSMLGIKSFKNDWLAKGKSLNDAITILSQKVAKGEQSTEQEIEDVPWEELNDEIDKEETKEPRDPATIQTGAQLLRFCFDDFGLQPEKVYAELNIKSLNDLTELPSAAYARIAAVRNPSP
jgi:hypothetical protein